MANKAITQEGKTKILELILNGDNGFCYLALGDGNSNAAAEGISEKFSEISGNDYHRVKTNMESSDTQTATVTVSAIFEDDNYTPSQGGEVSEIALVDSYEKSSNNTFLAFAEIPPILKTSNISLKYTIVFSIL